MQRLIAILVLTGISGGLWAQNPTEPSESVGVGVQWTGIVPGFSAKWWFDENLGLQPTAMIVATSESGFLTGDLRMLYRTTRHGRIHPYFGAGAGIGYEWGKDWEGKRWEDSWGGVMLFSGAELIFLFHFGPEIGFFVGRPMWGDDWAIIPMGGFGLFWYF
jgi:hypothetical protein